MTQIEHQPGYTFQLPDNRQLGYAILGTPDGYPVFFFHGTPGSRLIFSDQDPIAQIPGIQLILPERPGYGLSSPQPGRTILQWAEDVEALADHLNFERFIVAGESGGGPYALACAHQLPRRIEAVFLLASPSPTDSRNVRRAMSFGNRLFLGIGRLFPGVIRRSLKHMATSFHTDSERTMDSLKAQMSHSDQVMMENPAVREALARDIREAYRQGGEGHAEDAMLVMFGKSWGFELKDISTPVHIWHGDEDRQAPLAMAEHLASEIPDCSLRVIPGAGHLIVDYEEVITDVRDLAIPLA